MANERARTLRRNMTDAELALWDGSRGGQLSGFRFQRQHPIGVFIVDFVCLEKRLIIEVDGNQHSEFTQMMHDAERSQWLEGKGYRVVRFWTNEITEDKDSVLDAIWASLQDLQSSRPRPSPSRRSKIDWSICPSKGTLVPRQKIR
jgi:very-short-patch-repair endonuclease